MPRKPLRQCAIATCKNLVENDGDIYCKEHKPKEIKKYDKYLRGYKSSKRYDSRWNKLRNIYIKEHPFCEECMKENKFIKATVVHHKVPVEVDETRRYDLTNFESLCDSHHKRIHDKLGAPEYKF